MELMVASASIGLLVALFVPAAQDARDIARSVACRNQMKQIGLGFHNYHAVYNSLPAAWYARYADGDSVSWTGWSFALLPYLDQAGLYNRGTDVATNPQWPTVPDIPTVPLSAYRCPADTLGDMNPMRGGFAINNYSGNAGSKAFPRLYSGAMQQYWPGSLPAVFEPAAKQDRLTAGIFQLNGRVGFRDIVDGTSNTLMASERAATSGAGIWMGVRSNQMENDVITEFSEHARLNASITGASSFHNSSVNALLADGSTRVLSQDIESGPVVAGQIKVLQALAGRMDGTPLSSF